MKTRHVIINPVAEQDAFDAWRLVYERDGEERADSLRKRIMAFILSLGEFAAIGTRHDDTRPGLRSTGVPGLKTASVFFVVSGDKVTVVGVSYLGRDVWSRFEE